MHEVQPQNGMQAVEAGEQVVDLLGPISPADSAISTWVCSLRARRAISACVRLIGAIAASPSGPASAG